MAARELVQNLPPKARRWFFGTYAVLGVVLTAIQAGFGAAEAGMPVWLTVSWAVYGALGGGFGLTAATNVNAQPVVIPDGDGRYRADVTSEALDNVRAHPEGPHGA